MVAGLCFGRDPDDQTVFDQKRLAGAHGKPEHRRNAEGGRDFAVGIRDEIEREFVFLLKLPLGLDRIAAHAEDLEVVAGEVGKRIAQRTRLRRAARCVGFRIKVNERRAFRINLGERDRFPALVGSGNNGGRVSRYEGVGFLGSKEIPHDKYQYDCAERHGRTIVRPAPGANAPAVKILLPVLSLVSALFVIAPAARDVPSCLGAVARVRLGEPAGFGDHAFAGAVAALGWDGALLLRTAVIFLIVFAAMVAAGWASNRIAPLRWRSVVRRGYLILIALIGLVGAIGFGRSLFAPAVSLSDLLPSGLLSAVPAGSAVFTNPAAATVIAAVQPALVTGIPVADRLAAIASPVKWRELDRTHRFGAVVLAGNPGEARGLIEHLLQSPDWRLALVDDDGILFLRGAGSRYVPPSPGANDPGFSARLALNLQLVGFKTEARAILQSALERSPGDPAVLAAAASLNGSQGRWEKARELAERALDADAARFEARYILACALLETRNPGKALTETDRLLRQRPSDVQTLLLRARAARAVNDPDTEIDALEQLLGLVPPSSPDAARLRVFLGQAWAKKGFADRAVQAYEAALSGSLDPAAANDVRDAIRAIRENRPPAAP